MVAVKAACDRTSVDQSPGSGDQGEYVEKNEGCLGHDGQTETIISGTHPRTRLTTRVLFRAPSQHEYCPVDEGKATISRHLTPIHEIPIYSHLGRCWSPLVIPIGSDPAQCRSRPRPPIPARTGIKKAKEIYPDLMGESQAPCALEP